MASPIDPAIAATWADRRTGPPEAAVEPTSPSLRRALALCRRAPAGWQGYLRAAVLRAGGRDEVELRSPFATFRSSRRDHYWFKRPVFEEPFETALVARLVDEGATVVDVGANRGWYALLAAHEAAITGRVLAFEPGAVARGELERHLAINPGLARRIEVWPVALGASDGTAGFVQTADSTLGHLSLPGVVADTSVGVRALASVLEEADIDEVGLVKVDVEGAEVGVLEGLAPRMASVAALLVEVVPDQLARFGSTVEELRDLLDPTHERWWVCWRHGRLEPMDGGECADSGRNLLALARPRADELRRRLVATD